MQSKKTLIGRCEAQLDNLGDAMGIAYPELRANLQRMSAKALNDLYNLVSTLRQSISGYEAREYDRQIGC